MPKTLVYHISKVYYMTYEPITVPHLNLYKIRILLYALPTKEFYDYVALKELTFLSKENRDLHLKQINHTIGYSSLHYFENYFYQKIDM